MPGKYCRNCGKEVPHNAYACLNCGLPPMKGQNFCNNCGAASHQDAVICIKCGIYFESKPSASAPYQQASSSSQSTINTPGNSDLFGPRTAPKSWLAESILVTLFCCMPFGIVGIVNASKVESRFYAGDTEGALRASEEAKKWTTISFWVGIIIGVVYGIIVAAAGSYDNY